MSRGACTFKESDAARLIRAALKAGCKVVRVETDKNGKIIVVTDEAAAQTAQTGLGANEWDQVL